MHFLQLHQVRMKFLITKRLKLILVVLPFLDYRSLHCCLSRLGRWRIEMRLCEGVFWSKISFLRQSKAKFINRNCILDNFWPRTTFLNLYLKLYGPGIAKEAKERENQPPSNYEISREPANTPTNISNRQKFIWHPKKLHSKKKLLHFNDNRMIYINSKENMFLSNSKIYFISSTFYAFPFQKKLRAFFIISFFFGPINHSWREKKPSWIHRYNHKSF